VRTTPVRAALAFAVRSILFDADGKSGELLVHIAAAAVAAEVFFSAAGRLQEVGYFAAFGALIFKYGHHLLPLLKDTYDMMNAPNNQQQIGHPCNYERMPRLHPPGGQGEMSLF
jgi:hypothetical protein